MLTTATSPSYISYSTNDTTTIYNQWITKNINYKIDYMWKLWSNQLYGSTTTTQYSKVYVLDSLGSSIQYNNCYPTWVAQQREYRTDNPYQQEFQTQYQQEPYRPPEIIQQERERQQQAQAKLRRKTDRANETARQLLMEQLTPEQQQMVDKLGMFHVITESGNRYEVDINRRAGNVFLLDHQGRRIESHCIHNSQGVPVPLADNALAQKLLLECDEKKFRRIANTRRLQAC